MFRILLAFGMLCIMSEAFAQKQVSLGYAGAYFTRPGLHMSYQSQLKSLSSKKDKITHKAFFGGVQLGAYYHPNMQWGTYVAPELSFQKQNEKGFRIGYELGAGALLTQMTNLYTSTDAGYEKAGFKPQAQLILTPAISLGKEMNTSWADAWFIKNRVMLMPLYAEQSTFRYFFEIGFTKKISSND